MKKNLITFLVTLLTVTTLTAGEAYYLKIKRTNGKEISYPPGLKFVVEDNDGNTILSPSDLEALKIYDIEKPIVLYVFTYWNDQPDMYTLDSGKLLYIKKHTNDTSNNKSDTYAKRRKSHEIWMPSSGQQKIFIKQKQYFANDTKTSYNLSIEFSNNVIFYYKDGNASAWQNGKKLNITKNYFIETNEGVIKLSYNPQNKKLWWILDKK